VRAFESTDWKDNRQLRAKVLNQIADHFEARTPELIQILSLDNGKVQDEAAFEVDVFVRFTAESIAQCRHWISISIALLARLSVSPARRRCTGCSPNARGRQANHCVPCGRGGLRASLDIGWLRGSLCTSHFPSEDSFLDESESHASREALELPI
jgi:hypothetical protein